MSPVAGQQLVCGTTLQVVMATEGQRLWQFWDYSWPCPSCGIPHCSECGYATDGRTIVVHDCGRFGEARE